VAHVHLSTEFCENRLNNFYAISLTNKEKNWRRRKHNLLDGGNKRWSRVQFWNRLNVSWNCGAWRKFYDDWLGTCIPRRRLAMLYAVPRRRSTSGSATDRRRRSIRIFLRACTRSVHFCRDSRACVPRDGPNSSFVQLPDRMAMFSSGDVMVIEHLTASVSPAGAHLPTDMITRRGCRAAATVDSTSS